MLTDLTLLSADQSTDYNFHIVSLGFLTNYFLSKMFFNEGNINGYSR